MKIQLSKLSEYILIAGAVILVCGLAWFGIEMEYGSGWVAKTMVSVGVGLIGLGLVGIGLFTRRRNEND